MDRLGVFPVSIAFILSCRNYIRQAVYPHYMFQKFLVLIIITRLLVVHIFLKKHPGCSHVLSVEFSLLTGRFASPNIQVTSSVKKLSSVQYSPNRADWIAVHQFLFVLRSFTCILILCLISERHLRYFCLYVTF